MKPSMWRSWPVVVLVAAASAFGQGSKDRSKAKSGHELAVSHSAIIDPMIQDKWKAAKIKPSKPATDEEFLRPPISICWDEFPTYKKPPRFWKTRITPASVRSSSNICSTIPISPRTSRMSGGLFSSVASRRAKTWMLERLSTWLRTQIVSNRPWNEIAHDLITAKSNNKENGAVNYPLSHMEDGAVNLTSFTTRIFLGQQIQCTQCHDHPTNSWKQADFWGINAFFKGMHRTRDEHDATGAEVYDHTELHDEPTNAYSRYEKRNAVVGIAYPTYLDGTKPGQSTSALAAAGTDTPDALSWSRTEGSLRAKSRATWGADHASASEGSLRDTLGKLITEKDQRQLARAFINRVWGRLTGRGFVHPVDDFGDHNTPSHPELLEKMTDEFIASKFDIKGSDSIDHGEPGLQRLERHDQGERKGRDALQPHAA